MLPLGPNLTCAISNLGHCSVLIPDRRYKPIGEWIADKIGWNVASRVHAPNPVRPRCKSQILTRGIETDHGRCRSIEQTGAYPGHQFVGQLVRDAEAGRVVAHEDVVAWVKSWGRPDELPMPECK